MVRWAVAVGAGAILLGLAIAFWTWPEKPRPSGGERTGASGVPVAPHSTAKRTAQADGEPAGARVETAAAESSAGAMLADARHYCSDLLLGVGPKNFREIYAGRDVGPECMAALEGMFLREGTGRIIVPLSRPMTWEDLFNDVRGDVEAVLAALGKEECVTRPDDIRADLAETCAARPMAEVARLRDVCGFVFPSALGQDWRDETAAPFYAESGVVVPENFSNYWNSAKTRQRQADKIAAYSQGITEEPNDSRLLAENRPAGELDGRAARMAKLDRAILERQRASYRALAAQERQFPGRRMARLDEEFFRTSWLASQCAPHYPALRWMADRPEQFQGLMARAASLGDEFALTDRLASRQQAEQLMDTNPMQALLHLAQLEGQAIDREWEAADKEFRRKAMLPHFETRRALLALAGIECEEPCAEADLYALEQERARDLESWRTSCFIKREACKDLSRLDALRAQLWDTEMELSDTKAERSLPYRKRRDTAKLRRVLTAEALAARSGVTLNRDALYYGVANPDRLDALTEDELAEIRFEAEGMAAAIWTDRDHAGS